MLPLLAEKFGRSSHPRSFPSSRYRANALLYEMLARSFDHKILENIALWEWTMPYRTSDHCRVNTVRWFAGRFWTLQNTCK